MKPLSRVTAAALQMFKSLKQTHYLGEGYYWVVRDGRRVFSAIHHGSTTGTSNRWHHPPITIVSRTYRISHRILPLIAGQLSKVPINLAATSLLDASPLMRRAINRDSAPPNDCPPKKNGSLAILSRTSASSPKLHCSETGGHSNTKYEAGQSKATKKGTTCLVSF